MYKQIIEKLKDKNIAILGFVKEGKSTYNFIRRHLKQQHLTIIDKNNITISDEYVTVITGEDYLTNLEKYDLIIKSPGISLKDENISPYQSKLTSQLELILEINRNNIIPNEALDKFIDEISDLDIYAEEKKYKEEV